MYFDNFDIDKFDINSIIDTALASVHFSVDI
jgi:hypothetical protein